MSSRQTLREFHSQVDYDPNLHYKQAALEQISWVGHKFSYLVWNCLLDPDKRDEYTLEVRNSMVTVDGMHTSKSCKLPVYRFDVNGRTFKMRGNFYDWCVRLFFPLEKPFPSWMNVETATGYFEGMDTEEDLKANHSFCLVDKEQLYAVMWWVMREGINNVK